MTTKVAKTPDGVVVRIIRASGECSYRKNIDGTWAMCGDHKGPWISLPEIDIPITARNVVAALTEDNRPGTFNECASNPNFIVETKMDLTTTPPCERPASAPHLHPRYPSGWCVACGAAPEEGCRTGGPTEAYPDKPYCKPDQSCCDFACGN